MTRVEIALPLTLVEEFCARWQIAELALFGSALRNELNTDSDLDFLVTFDPAARWSLLDHVQMKLELEEILGREVDLLTRPALEKSGNWIRQREILATARVIYRASNPQYGSCRKCQSSGGSTSS